MSLFSFPEVKPNNRFAENAGLQSDDEIRDQVQEFAAREGFLPC